MTLAPGRSGAVLALVLAAVAVPYLPGLHNGFVWLDHREIVEGALIAEDLGDLTSLFARDRNFAGYHRPVYDALHSLDRALWGLEPFGFHLSSLFLHLANVALVFALALRLGWRTGAAAALGLVWGLHPVNSEVAGLIHAKADAFSLTALLASLGFFLGPRERPSPAAAGWTGCALSFALALYTKEIAFLFPAGVTLWWLAGGAGAPRREVGRYAILLWLLAAAVLLHRSAVTPPSEYVSPLGLGERILTFGTVYVHYARQLFLPLEPSIADTVVRFSALSAASKVWHGALLALLIGFQAALWLRFPPARKWIALYHLALLPVAQLVPILHFRADRFLYVPSLAFAALVVEAARSSLEARSGVARRTAAAAAIAALVLACAACAWIDLRRVRAFESDLTLFQAELALEPRYREGHSHLARAFDRQGLFQRAEPHWLAALDPPPEIVSYLDLPGALLGATYNLLAQRKPHKALALIERFGPEVRSPTHREHLDYNRAVALHQIGRHAQALLPLRTWLARHPEDADATFLTARSAQLAGEPHVAREAFERYLALRPAAPDRAQVEEWLRELANH